MTVLSAALALVAFAANSLLCRMALAGGLIDPVTFTVLRLTSGAAVLLPIAVLARESSAHPVRSGSFASGIALFVYALAFSLAYLSLSTGTGALILFGAVQATMLGAGLWSGERPGRDQWVGLVVALVGLVYLVAPGVTAPDFVGALLMLAAGVAWGVYSLRGRGVSAPVAASSANFARAGGLAVAAGAAGWLFAGPYARPAGAAIAIVSGTVTSGLGYVAWYRALRGLTATRAAIVQLLVPVLAAAAGVLVLSEAITLRLTVAGALVFGGVAIAMRRR